MRSFPAPPLAALAALLVLSACASATDVIDDARDAVESAVDEAADAGDQASLTVTNNTEGPLCDVHVGDLDDPDSEGYDLLAEGAQLAPGASLVHVEGDHPDSDDHNLTVSARGCDGTEYLDYHFSYVIGGGTYSVSDSIRE